MKTDKQIACNNWEKIGMLKERKRILELIDEFGDKILNVNATSKNFIEIPDFEYRLKLLKKGVEK